MKRCTKCRMTLPLDDFAKTNQSQDGRRSWCKPCRREYCRKWAATPRPQGYAIPPDGKKNCARCKERKPLEDFSPSPRAVTGRGSYCRPCARANAKRWATEHPERVVELRLKRQDNDYYRHRAREDKYGLTPGAYAQMVAAQDGVCAICHRPNSRFTKRGQAMELAVDHNHQTGLLRELLCTSCNSGLGLFDDDPAALRAAADYLERHAAKDLTSTPAA